MGGVTKMTSVHRFLAVLLMLMLSVTAAYAGDYRIERVSDSVYAAIAQPGSKAVSNAFFVVTGYEVILAGAHFVPEGVKELVASIGAITPLPITTLILTHHHKGVNYYDYDLPEKAEVIISSNIWQTLKNEVREFKSATMVFDNAITLNRGKISMVVMNAGPGHSSGDTIVYLPNEGILFASDLLFNNAAGFMGEASIVEWGESLDMLEQLMPVKVVPGVGAVGGGEVIASFKAFYRDFMTEIIRNVDKGNTLAQTKKEFSLKKYRDLPGFGTFLETNIERAYKQYKTRK